MPYNGGRYCEGTAFVFAPCNEFHCPSKLSLEIITACFDSILKIFSYGTQYKSNQLIFKPFK